MTEYREWLVSMIKACEKKAGDPRNHELQTEYWTGKMDGLESALFELEEALEKERATPSDDPPPPLATDYSRPRRHGESYESYEKNKGERS